MLGITRMKALSALRVPAEQELDDEAADAIEDPAEDPATVLQRKERGAILRKCLAKLSAELTPDQLDQVKDGMTYGVLPATYWAYLSKVPELTESQKERIMAYLVEARELAMDGGTSEEKHLVFRKYKGKINNYLSAEGYTLQ